MELLKIVKEAMAARSKISEVNEKLKAMITEIEYKGVRIQVNAKNEFLSLNIPLNLLSEEKENIEKIILGAFEEAGKKARSAMVEEVSKIIGRKIPGL